MSRRLALLAVLVCMAGPAAAATVQDHQEALQDSRKNLREERQNLNTLRRQLKQEKKAVSRKRKQERSILFEIQQADRRIEDAEDRYEEHQRNLALLSGQTATLRQAIAESEASLDELRRLLASRLRLLYRERLGGFWRFLISAQTLSDMTRRLKFMHVFAAQNTRLIEQVGRKKSELLVRHRELSRRERQVKELEAAAVKTLATLRVQKAGREKMLNRVRTSRVEHEKAVRELDTASKKLNRLVAELERRTAKLQNQIRLSGLGFKQHQRHLPWPTRGRVISRFGKTRHPRFNTYLVNKGIDIAGPIGQNVYSVAQGRVLFAEWFEGYGRMVILDHGDGYNSIYAHLKTIQVSEGQSITERQAIGQLGDSGTWKEPSLYFEIRLRGQALDPQQWLER